MSSGNLDFPLIYCNGDSYSDENYKQCMRGQTYAHHVANHLGGYVINNAIAGSCNRRILRSTCHDLLHQRELNPDQKIIALIGLSFEIRDELWIDDLTQDRAPQESHFRTHQFSDESDWKQDLFSNKLLINSSPYLKDKKFLRKWSEGRAYFYSSYAERINLLMDVLLLTVLLDKLDIQYLVFQAPRAEKLQQEYLLEFFKTRLDNKRIFDFENFSFCDWCYQAGFQTLDPNEPGNLGHYGPDAHLAFAENVVLPTLLSLDHEQIKS
jgi:hypothetical protein